MLSMKMVNGKTGKYLSYIQWNLSTMATMGTEESGHYNEVAAVKTVSYTHLTLPTIYSV